METMEAKGESAGHDKSSGRIGNDRIPERGRSCRTVRMERGVLRREVPPDAMRGVAGDTNDIDDLDDACRHPATCGDPKRRRRQSGPVVVTPRKQILEQTTLP